MKRTLTTSLAALILGGSATLALWPGSATPVLADHHEAGGQAHEDHETLEHAMEIINTNYRSARRNARDAAKNGETADALAEMITAATQAKGALPGIVHAANGETKSELTTVYRKTMNDLIIILAQAENAALAGENDKLNELLLQANEIKAAGHELFIPDDDK